MLTTPSGSSASWKNAGEVEGGEGRGLGGLEDAGVAGGQSRGEFPGGHEEREIPRDHLTRDAERRGGATGKGVVQFVGPTGVVEEVGGDEWEVDVAAFFDRLAAVHRFEHGQFAGFFLNEPGDAVEIFRAFATGHFPPDFGLRAAGGGDGAVNILGVGEGDIGEFLLGSRVDRGEGFAGCGRGELAVDEKIVTGVDLDRGRLGSGSVGPGAELESALVGRDGSQRVGGGVRVAVGRRQGAGGLFGFGFWHGDGDGAGWLEAGATGGRSIRRSGRGRRFAWRSA